MLFDGIDAEQKPRLSPFVLSSSTIDAQRQEHMYDSGHAVHRPRMVSLVSSGIEVAVILISSAALYILMPVRSDASRLTTRIMLLWAIAVIGLVIGHIVQWSRPATSNGSIIVPTSTLLNLPGTGGWDADVGTVAITSRAVYVGRMCFAIVIGSLIWALSATTRNVWFVVQPTIGFFLVVVGLVASLLG